MLIIMYLNIARCVMLKTKAGSKTRLTTFSRVYQLISGAVHNSFKLIPSHQYYNITLCNEYKFIWFRVAKVCTRTIFNELKKNNIALDAVHPMSVYYPINLYKNYFKFAFIRNPWDRMCSCWRHKVVDSNYYNFNSKELTRMKKFDQFVNFIAANINVENCDHHLRLQSKLIDLNNIDYLGRFETFNDDIANVFRKLEINLDQNNISMMNASKNAKPYQKYYNDDIAQKVYKIYQKDIQIFNYKF